MPVYVQLQVMHQLAVTSRQAADVAVLLGGQHLEIHRIGARRRAHRPVDRAGTRLGATCNAIRRRRRMGSESAEQALRCLYPEDHGHTPGLHPGPTVVGRLR
ncbi:hypothetical protein ACPA9J_08800 [Pseudomonas aeruginosa]